MTTTTGTQTTRSCPPSAVADQILTWAEVQEGDLVLHDGELRLAEKRVANTLRPDIKVSFRLSGMGMWQTFLLDRLTAVRRYDISQEQDR